MRTYDIKSRPHLSTLFMCIFCYCTWWHTEPSYNGMSFSNLEIKAIGKDLLSVLAYLEKLKVVFNDRVVWY
jgi:hypothetical protein